MSLLKGCPQKCLTDSQRDRERDETLPASKTTSTKTVSRKTGITKDNHMVHSLTWAGTQWRLEIDHRSVWQDVARKKCRYSCFIPTFCVNFANVILISIDLLFSGDLPMSLSLQVPVHNQWSPFWECFLEPRKQLFCQRFCFWFDMKIVPNQKIVLCSVVTYLSG